MFEYTKKDILQNLKDAGCDEEMVQKFMRCVEAKDDNEEMLLLEKYRECLLEHVHQEEQKISCLDYLAYRLKEMKGK